ncbi:MULTISPECIES: hypothetical protein [Actinomycetes]|uniref:hypothetical protein n=1 Tax=Actinomycetes TaxID=1760 RepID=UPI000A5AD942|nr:MULTISPECIES: hypothetical protein [Actinomycetes]
MIEDWYFGCCIDLPPRESQTFLDVLDCLRTSGTAVLDGSDYGSNHRLLLTAYAELARLETAARRYALPPMLTAGLRHSASPRILAAVRHEAAHSLETLDRSVRAPLEQAIQLLLDDGGGDEVVSYLNAAALSARQRPIPPRSTIPYLDTEDFTAEILLLAVLLQALVQDPTLVGTVVEEDGLVSFAHRAIDGRFGRLALILAVDLATFAGDRLISRDELRTKLDAIDAGAPAYEPDLLAAHARLVFGTPGSPGHDAPARDAVDAIHVEAFTLERLRAVRRRSAVFTQADKARQAVARLGLNSDPVPVISSVLWQAILWEMAGDIDPVATSRFVAECWIPEHQPPKGEVRVSGPVSSLRQWRTDLADLGRLRITGVEFRTSHGKLHRSTLVSVLVLSPWINRSDNRWSNTVSKFTRVNDGLVLLRLFCAVPLAVRLLRTMACTEQQRERLIALILHAADVLSDKTHRDYLSNLAHGNDTAPSMTRPLSALALHVRRVVDRTGQGKFSGVEPRWFVDFAAREELPNRTARQETYLRGVPALNVVDFWVTDALSAAVPDDGIDRLTSRWLAPVGETGSRSLAEWALDTSLRRQPRGLAAKPAALLVAYLGVNDTARRRMKSWHERSTAAEVRSVWQVIGTGWLTADDWRNILPPSLNADLRVVRAMTTERLLAVFQDGEGKSWPEVDGWIRDWREAHQEVRQVMDLSRPARRRLVDLLAAPVTGEPGERMVLEEVIDIELEFGMGTPTDRWALFDRLNQRSSLPRHLAQALRLRLLIGLYHRGSVVESRSSAQSPWEVIDQERSDALLNRLLQTFIFQLGRTTATVAGHEHLRDAIPGLWWMANRTHSLVLHEHELTLPVTTRRVDGRRLAGVTVDRVRDILQLHCARPPELTTGPAVLDPHQLGADDLRTLPGLGTGGVLGVVCAVTPTSVWVNCSLDDPLEVELPTGGRAEIGDLVAVPLVRSTHPTYRVEGKIRFLEGAPQVGDVRAATVTGHEIRGRTWLRIMLNSGDGVTPRSWLTNDTTLAGTAVLRRWDPDVLRALAGRPVAQIETMAQWSGMYWLPVDWGMAEFLAVDAANAVETPLRLVLIDDLPDAEALRCSSAPGRVGIIPDSAWYPNHLRELRAAIDADGAYGLAVSVKVTENSGTPQLQIVPNARLGPDDRWVDRRNVRWREQFQDGAENLAVRSPTGVWMCHTGDSALPEIVVEGLATKEAITTFVPTVWDDADQRQARVAGRATPTQALRLGPPAVDTFHRIVDVNASDRLKLRAALPGISWGLTRGYTDENLLVDIEAESLTLSPIDQAPPDRRFVKNRVLEVVQVYYPARRDGPREHTPLPTKKLLELIGHEARSVAEDALVRAKEFRGLVVRAPKHGQDRDFGVSTVWLEAHDTVFSMSLPLSAFDHTPSGAGAIISARLTDQGWVFTARTRRIRVRALWTVDDSGQGDDRGLFLGVVQWRGRPSALIQSTDSPVLRIMSAKAWRTADHLSKAGYGGIPYATALVETSRIFSNSYQRITLRIGSAGKVALAGQTRETNPTERARATAIHMRLHSVDADYVAVQRVFILDDARGSDRSVADASYKDPLADYRGYLAGSQGPLPAQLNGESMRLTTGWQVPVAGQPSWTAPLAPGERPWVDVTYDRGSLVVLCGDELDQRVSYRQTPAVAPGQFVAEFQRQGLVIGIRSSLRTPLNYVDRRTTPRGVVHRMEWGYGKVVEILDDDLTLDGVRLSKRSKVLFHGDVLRAVQITNAAHGAYRVDIATSDIRWGWHSQIFYEADQGTVHLAEVDLSPDGEHARIARLLTRNPNGWRENKGHEGVMAVQLSRARFSPTAREDIKQACSERRTGSANDSNPVYALVKLETSLFLNSRGYEVSFNYLSPDRLPTGSRVFMTATRMQQLINDVRLHLVLDDVLGSEGKPRLTVGVTKREFSRRSQLLSNLYATDREALTGSVYLVKLRDPAVPVRPGQIRDALARSTRALISLLRNAEATCVAAVTPLRNGQIELELEPGTVFKLNRGELSGDIDLPRGSLARLSLDRENRITLRTALLGDSAYLHPEGRAVLLLPMQNIISKRRTMQEALAAGTYSVAGLPSVTVPAKSFQNATSFERKLLTTPHPRVAWLRPNATGGQPVLSDEKVAAGTVDFEAAGNAVVVELASGDRHPIDLSELSYFDGSAAEITKYVEGTWWTYHDTTTSHRDPENVDRVAPHSPLTRRARMTNEPVFFSPGWTLRHNPKHFVRYGFPPTGLLDMLASTGREQEFPVAGRSGHRDKPDGIWVEQAPGRLVHLTGAMLTVRAGDTVVPLDNFAWEHFAAGDIVRLRPDSRTSTEIASIELLRWVPGSRAAFGGYALLPVVKVDGDAGLVQLGGGIWLLNFPLDPASEPPSGHVRLTPGNKLVAASPPRPRDVVLLGVRDGKLEILGAPGLRITLADRGWADWIRKALTDPFERDQLIQLCGGALPVSVESVVGDTVNISRNRQGDFALRPGQLVPVRPLGRLRETRVLLRRGGKLSLCQERDLVPGLPACLLEEAIQCLSVLENDLWIHVNAEGRLRVGLPEVDADSSVGEEASLEPIALIGKGDGHGVLCWDARHGRPRWLPATLIGWTELTDGEIERHIVQGKRALTAQILPDGSASMVGRAVNEQRSRHLRSGQTIRTEVVDETFCPVDGRRVRFLARAYLSDMLLRVDWDALREPPSPGEVYVCEVDSVRFNNGRASVVAVLPGTRQVAMDLPRWIAEQRRPDRLPGWSEADGATAHASIVLAAVKADGDLRAIALPWLEAHGSHALHLTTETTLDAVPMLAAVLVVDSISTQAPPGAVRDLCGNLAVSLCRHLGLRAARSRHVEPIVATWLSDSPTVGFDDLWRRLDWLTIAPSITTKDRDAIRTVYRGIRARTAVRPEPDLDVVSSALAASVGLHVDYSELSAHNRNLGPLVGLARALTPHPSGKPAQRALLDDQRKLLRDTLARLINKPPMFVSDSTVRKMFSDDGVTLHRAVEALQNEDSPRSAHH